MTLRKVIAVAGKELRALLASPVPYVVGAAFQGFLGVLMTNQLDVRGQAVVQPLFPLAGFLLLLTVPLLGMRTFADEVRRGTLDVLLAVPVSPTILVVGKWLAITVTSLAVLAPSAVFVGVVASYGDPDLGPAITGYVGLTLLVVLLCALAVLGSTLTSSQPVAAMTALVVSLLLWFAHVGSEAVSAGDRLVARISLSERLRTFAGGGVDSGDLVFFVVTTVAVLAVGVLTVDARRLR